MKSKEICDEVAEILPWLLNGTLGEAERDRALGHIRACAACREDLSGAREAWHLFDSHPPSGLLVAFAFGETVDTIQELEAHLEGCATCREELELVRENREIELLAWPRSASNVAVWRRSFFAAAAVAAIAVGTILVTVSSQKTHATDPPKTTALNEHIVQLTEAKAQLETERDELIGKIKAGESILGEIKDRLDALERPQINIPILELLPTNFRLRGMTEETVVDRSSAIVTLILATSFDSDFDEFRLTITGDDGTSLRQTTGLILNPTNDFTLQLPIRSLPNGSLTLSIEGLDSGRWTPLEEYRLRIKD